MQPDMIKKKYILHVTGMHSLKYGGIEQLMTVLAKELKLHDYTLLLMYNSYPKSDQYIKSLLNLDAKIFISNALNPARFFKDFIHVLFKYRPTIIHAHFQPALAVFYSKLFNYKNRFVTLHMMITDENYSEVSDIRSLRWSTRIHRLVINTCATRFFPVSNAVIRQYQNLYPETKTKLELFYLGAAPNPFPKQKVRARLDFKDDCIYIACVAFCSNMKGIDVLIGATSILKIIYGHKNFKVCLIGLDEKHPYTKELKEVASAKNVGDEIIWFDIIDNVPEILSATDIYCQPSRTEALPLAIMEAGMAGLPVIASRVGGIPEVVTDGLTGLLFEVDDTEQLAVQLNCLISDKELRQKMGEQSKAHMMTKFNLNKQVQELCKIYLDSVDK